MHVDCVSTVWIGYTHNDDVEQPNRKSPLSIVTAFVDSICQLMKCTLTQRLRHIMTLSYMIRTSDMHSCITPISVVLVSA